MRTREPWYAVGVTSHDIPARIAPADDELAVLSLLASRCEGAWRVSAARFCRCPSEQAWTSWRRWAEREPRSRERRLEPGVDPGPVFTVDPFPGLRAVRAVAGHAAWDKLRTDLGAGRSASSSPATPSRRSPGRRRPVDAGRYVGRPRRRVRSAASCQRRRRRLPEVPVAVSADTWELAVPPHLPRGPDLGAIAPHRRELHWPRSLLGIGWLGTPEHEPPQAFVVGRALHGAWIADVRSNADSGEIELAIGWREDRVDPLGLSIYARSHKDGLPLLARQLRVSDLPPRGDLPELDPRRRPWRDRVLSIGLPRGPRRTDWGVQLLDAGGQLLDERPVVPRVERIEMSIRVDGGQPASSFVIGDRKRCLGARTRRRRGPGPSAGGRGEARGRSAPDVDDGSAQGLPALAALLPRRRAAAARSLPPSRDHRTDNTRVPGHARPPDPGSHGEVGRPGGDKAQATGVVVKRLPRGCARPP